MTIAEIINENGIVTRIDYWNDGQVRVVQSHGYSLRYMLKRKYGVKEEILAVSQQSEIDFVVKLWNQYAPAVKDIFPIVLDYQKIFAKIREEQPDVSFNEVKAQTRVRLENLCNAKYISHKLMECKK